MINDNRKRIGFIGAGKVGTSFGHYLFDHGVIVSGYYDRHPERGSNAAKVTESIACGKVSEITRCSDIILITTQDDYIQNVCEMLCDSGNIACHHLVGHMSGAHASTILDSAQKKGATIFSLHPLQAFADEKSALVTLPNTFFSLEGQGEYLPEVERMLVKIGNPFFWIDSSRKSLYHLSACVMSNYLVTLIDHGLIAFEKSGADWQQGFFAMRQLIESTLDNIASLGTARALTGPIARGDNGTVERHIEALEMEQMAEYKRFYAFMGRLTMKLATRQNLLSSDTLNELRRLLV